ncbi:hypothetical protein RF55_16472 [Lasius niger]|uniref:Uncharacterized protein n=1 Tax=Lasius niger TaxID=67767 RepID=A0A0J7K4D0_LASNI|nr:hypothetical protein RF55_16472 [Lasius niger]
MKKMSQELDAILRTQALLRIARAHENMRKMGAANVTQGTVEARLDKANWSKFETQHDQLQLEHEAALREHDYMRKDFFGVTEEHYVQQKGIFLDLLRTMKNGAPAETGATAANSAAATGQPSSRVSLTPRTTLPRIQLPTFTGKYEDWLSFRDLFVSIISKDTTLTNVERLHYLKTSLKGEAERLVRNFTITDANFDRAWAALVEHYENKRLLVKLYCSAFTALQKMKGETPSELKRVFHGITGTLSALEGIGRPIANCMDLFIHMVVELLDPRSRRE